MNALRLLNAALYLQGLLGLAGFGLPFFGVALDERVWLIHPLNGAAIAVASLVLFRPRPGVAAGRARVAARFAPLVALALGLGLASVRGLLGPLVGTLLHMAVGFTAIELVGRAVAELTRGADAEVRAAASRPGGAA